MPKQNKKIIIGLVGQIAAGKGACAQYLKNKYRASVYRFSTIIRQTLDILCLPQNRKNMQLLSTVLRQNFGENILAKAIAQKVKKDKNKIIVVDGIRRLADIKYLQKMNNFILTKITAKTKTRYYRLKKRKENKGDAAKTYKEFLADQQKEAEKEIPKVMSQAAKTINNNGSRKTLYRQIEKLLRN